MSPRALASWGALVLVLGVASGVGAAPKTIKVSESSAPSPPSAPSAPSPPDPPNAPGSATAAVRPKQSPARASSGAPLPGKPGVRRPLMLDVQRIEGRADGPRVLFVHAGPQIALEDAPEHPTYLRDDFTAALSSPVRIRVRPYETLRLPTKGESR